MFMSAKYSKFPTVTFLGALSNICLAGLQTKYSDQTRLNLLSNTDVSNNLLSRNQFLIVCTFSSTSKATFGLFFRDQF